MEEIVSHFEKKNFFTHSKKLLFPKLSENTNAACLPYEQFACDIFRVVQIYKLAKALKNWAQNTLNSAVFRG